MFSLGVPKEAQEISSRHELHDDIDWVVVHTYAQHLHNVGMVEVAVFMYVCVCVCVCVCVHVPIIVH